MHPALVAVVQESPFSFLLVASQLDQAVGGGARHVQLALGYRCLPRVTCEHGLDQLSSRRAIPVVFHAKRPPLIGGFCPLLGRIVPSGFIQV